jgi:glycosyltransferase involved in cell wall biosynthesis
MNLLMVSGDRAIVEGRQGAFWYTLRSLAKHWDRIDIICPKPTNIDTSLTSALEKESVFFHANPRGLRSQTRWIQSKGAQLYRQHAFAAMTIHEYPPFYNGRGALRLAKKTGIPTLLEIHHIVGDPAPANFSERVGHMLSRFVLPKEIAKATATRTVNGSVRERLTQWGAPKEKIAVLPSFYLDRKLLTSTGAEEKKYDLVFCARLVANKGLGNVLTALAGLPKKTLLVIGDGPERASLEKQAASLGVTDRVTFLGWLPTHEDVVAALRSARVFLMNSTSEGGPRSVLEAMACGIPVIATPVGILPDVLHNGKNGLFTTGEPQDLTEQIEYLLSEPGRAYDMGQEAMFVLDSFDRDTLITAYSDFLKHLS